VYYQRDKYQNREKEEEEEEENIPVVPVSGCRYFIVCAVLGPCSALSSASSVTHSPIHDWLQLTNAYVIQY